MPTLSLGKWQLILLSLTLSFLILVDCAPTILTRPQTYSALTGEQSDVYMECRVANLTTGQTVSWKFVDHSVVVAVGSNISVTHPDKYEIVRQVKAGVSGGSEESWNLMVYKLEASDKGSYQCKVDGTSLTVTHKLIIRDAPPSQPTKPLNETDCCIAQGVESCALPVCDLSSNQLELLNILQTGADCIDNNLFKILQCGGDGRNHEGCCMRAGITEHCQPLCNYALKDPEHMSRDYTECIMQGLLIAQCLTEGQANLPSQPTSVSAISLGDGFLVQWSRPLENADLVVGYKIQYKQGTETNYTTTAPVQGTMKTFPNMLVDTVYTVRVIAVSDHGASAPSDSVQVATKSPVSKSQRNETIQACCLKRGVSSDCSEFCHADALDTGLHPDRVIPCFPQLNDIFTCLLGADVTPCCNRTRVPEECLPICSGRYFTGKITDTPCMNYLPLISACAIEGTHFLPSPPSNTHIVPGSTTHNSTVVTWDPPGDNSAKSYRVAWKPESTLGDTYTVASVVSGTRHQLTGLRESTLYRVLVVSENDVGSSLPELTLLVATKGVDSQTAPQPYNETACCLAKGVRPECLQVCNHTFRVSASQSEFINIGLGCLDALMPMLLCGTDERDHTHCCKQAGIPDKCLSLCQLTEQTTLVPSYDLVECIMLKESLSNCFEEGKAMFPKVPEKVSIQKTDMTSITLSWKAPTGGPNITSYAVEYSTDRQKWIQVTSAQTFKTVTGLHSDTMYILRVYSVSVNFTSLPSEMVIAYTLPAPDAGNVTIDWSQVWQNRSHCCDAQGLSATCLTVCQMGDVPPEECVADIDNIVKCGADGRDHQPCCQRYNVPEQCLPYCSGQSPSSLASQFCPPYMGLIMTCFTNGQGLLPTPPQHFRVTGYTNENITVEWDQPVSNCDQQCMYHGQIWEDGNQNTAQRQTPTSSRKTLTFTGLKPDTRYRVVVIARNGYGSSLPSTSILIVTRSNPFADITVSSDPTGLIDQGLDVVLRCSARSTPVLVRQVQWMRKNIILATNTLYTLRAVTKDDSGNYSCMVTYDNGETHSKDLWLNIVHTPEAKNPKEASVLPGINEKAYLQVFFTGFPSYVTWSREGQAITDMGKYAQWPLRPNYNTGLTLASLEIRNVVEADYGDYSCVGSNKFGNSTTMTLQLTNLVPTIPPLPTLSPNTSVSECCKAEGVLNDCLDLCTFTIDIKMMERKPYCISYISQYIKCGADHRDHTQCCTDKGIAEVCLSICRGEIPDFAALPQLDQCLGRIEDILWCAEDGQKYIPTQPQNVMAVMQFDQMLVSWTLPQENADKVQSYSIFYQSDEDATPLKSHVGSSKTSQLIGGVKKGSTYKIHVVAVNDWGKSRKSNETKLTVSSLLPRMPLNLQASLLDDAVDVRVKWSPPLSTVVITEYLLYYKPNKQGASYTAKAMKHQTKLTLTSTTPEHIGLKNRPRDYQLRGLVEQVKTLDTSVRLEQLAAETEYQMYVRAVSQDGPGETSQTIAITTGKPRLIRTSPSPQSGGKENTVGLAVGLVLALVLLVAVTVIALFLYRRMGRGKHDTGNGTVSFENPQYGDQNTGVKISGLPGSSQADNQFGYTTLNEETDTDRNYSDLDTNSSRQATDEHSHHYDNPLSQNSEGPAKLEIS